MLLCRQNLLMLLLLLLSLAEVNFCRGSIRLAHEKVNVISVRELSLHGLLKWMTMIMRYHNLLLDIVGDAVVGVGVAVERHVWVENLLLAQARSSRLIVLLLVVLNFGMILELLLLLLADKVPLSLRESSLLLLLLVHFGVVWLCK